MIASGFRPRQEGDNAGRPSRSPIRPPIELGRGVISVIKRGFVKEYISIRGLSISALKDWAFRPLNPLFYHFGVENIEQFSEPLYC